MRSCLYEGWITHRRREPVSHAFQFRLFFLYLDLEELDRAFAGRWLWSNERWNVACFFRRDHFGDSNVPLATCVRDLVEAECGVRPDGRVMALTHPRYFGYVFNPISLYYAFDADEQLTAIVAEVSNTPWRERHCYVLDMRSVSLGEDTLEARKAFHVSPFMPMNLDYRWRVALPGEGLKVQLDVQQQGRILFEANVNLKRREWSTSQLAWLLARFPLLTHRITWAIYWQAFRLWWKGAPFFPHPRHACPQAKNGEPQCGDSGNNALAAPSAAALKNTGEIP